MATHAPLPAFHWYAVPRSFPPRLPPQDGSKDQPSNQTMVEANKQNHPLVIAVGIGFLLKIFREPAASRLNFKTFPWQDGALQLRLLVTPYYLSSSYLPSTIEFSHWSDGIAPPSFLRSPLPQKRRGTIVDFVDAALALDARLVRCML